MDRGRAARVEESEKSGSRTELVCGARPEWIEDGVVGNGGE